MANDKNNKEISGDPRSPIPSAGLIMVILAASTISVMAGTTVSPIINKMRIALGVSSIAASFIITTHSLFVAFFSPVVGHVIDRIGTRKPLIFGLFLYAAAGGSGLLISSYWPLLGSRAFMGIAVALVFVAITVIITDLFQGADRAQMMGRRVGATNIGGVIWPLLGGFLGAYSWHLPFAIYLIGLPLGLLVFMTLPETHHKAMRSGTGKGSILGVFKSVPQLIIVYGLVLLTTMVLFTIVVFLPQLLSESGITDPMTIGLFISVLTLATGTTAFAYGKIKADLPYRYIVRSALAMWTIAMAIVALTSSELIIAAAVAVTGIGLGIMLPALLVWVGDISPPAFSGRTISLMGTFAYLGQFLTPALLGPIEPIVGFRGIFLTMGFLSVFVLLFLTLRHERRERIKSGQ